MATQLNNSGVLFPDGTTQTTGLVGVSNSTTTNTALGYQALVSNTSGGTNTAVGTSALYYNTTGGDNTAIGTNALLVNTTGIRNTAIGSQALQYNATGSNNTAVGRLSMYGNTTGSNNTAVGWNSLLENTTGNYNTATGFSALQSTNGSSNTANGYQAGYFQNNSNGNSYFGYQTGYYASNSQNVAIGALALFSGSAVTTAGSFVIGQTYTILSIGTTDFTAIGASSNLFDVVFTATGVGAGTGTAVLNIPGNGYNTVVGYQAMFSNTIGDYNVAIGNIALAANTTGRGHTAVGCGSLQLNTTGSYNTALGINALRDNTTGAFNDALGGSALLSNTTGSYNTALGGQALRNNTTGVNSVAVGWNTLYSNTTGNYNTALGYQSQYSINADSYNTSVGYQALTFAEPPASSYIYNSTALAVGETYIIVTPGTTDWTACGAPNSNAGTQFVAVSSAPSGTGTAQLVSDQSYTTAVGYQALQNNGNTHGVAVGYQALAANQTGSDNVAVGADSLVSNTNGFLNTAVGRASLQYNTTGVHNTAVGWIAMRQNTVGNWNVAVGRQAGAWQPTGNRNTMVGWNSHPYASAGSDNTAIGANSMLAAVLGDNNTAVGSGALLAYNSTVAATALVPGTQYVIVFTGTTNWAAVGAASNVPSTIFTATAVGTGTGVVAIANQYPQQSTALGSRALVYSTGTNCIGIGYNSGADSWINLTTQNNVVVIGNTSTATAYIRTAWSYSSDARDKNVLGTCPHGLDFVNHLKPVKYTLKTSRTDNTPSGIQRYGFLAQDILELEGNDSVIIDNSNEDSLIFNDASLTPVLVNAIQEMFKKLTSEIDTLKAEVAKLKGE